MKMKSYIAGPLDANNYLIWDEKSKEAVLIDCSEYRQDIVDFVNSNGLTVKNILLTHGHFDHVLGVNEMSKALDAKVGVHVDDVVMLDNINEFGRLFGFPEIEPPKYDFNLSDAQVLTLGDINIRVIHTPGHTEGGVCYLVDNKLFSGDTLFKGSYGRTDLFGGNFQKIEHSINDILFKLDDNIEVYPGHGESSTLRYEKLHNDINR